MGKIFESKRNPLRAPTKCSVFPYGSHFFLRPAQVQGWQRRHCIHDTLGFHEKCSGEEDQGCPRCRMSIILLNTSIPQYLNTAEYSKGQRPFKGGCDAHLP